MLYFLSSFLVIIFYSYFFSFFFFNDTATTEIYTLSLHDALPIYPTVLDRSFAGREFDGRLLADLPSSIDPCGERGDRKSTCLNSSHSQISYAVFCLKKKKKKSTHSLSTHLTHLSHREECQQRHDR